jgi:hypothetical protein
MKKLEKLSNGMGEKFPRAAPVGVTGGEGDAGLGRLIGICRYPFSFGPVPRRADRPVRSTRRASADVLWVLFLRLVAGGVVGRNAVEANALTQGRCLGLRGVSSWAVAASWLQGVPVRLRWLSVQALGARWLGVRGSRASGPARRLEATKHESQRDMREVA